MEWMKRTISLLLAVVMIITACPISAYAVTTDSTEEGGEIAASSYNDYLYTVLPDGTISICGYTGSQDGDDKGTYLEIPSSIDGIAVTQIAEEAFAHNDEIDTVIIPESITSVGNAAFYHCADLKAIVFCGTAPAFGFTVAEGSHALEKVFALESSDISMFCSLLVSDLGEDEAKGIEIVELESQVALMSAYSEYKASLDALLRGEEPEAETSTTLAEVIAEEITVPMVGEKVSSVEANKDYIICLHGTMNALTNTQGSNAWGTHTLATAACGDIASDSMIWTLEQFDGVYKLKNVNGYLLVDRNAASLNETGHAFELVYHGDDGWVIKSTNSNEYCNNLGNRGSIGGWSGSDTKFDLYAIEHISAEEVDPFGKAFGQWKQVSVDTETVLNEKEGLFAYAFDNNPNTHWHSNWMGAGDRVHNDANNPSNFEMIAGVIDFGAAYTINQFSFTPRQDTTSGQVTQASLYVSAVENPGENDWIPVAEHAIFSPNRDKKNICFEAQPVRYVKFVAEWSNDGWVAVSEFDVAYNEGHFTVSDSKTATCTEDGYATYTCACGGSYTEVIEATGHNWSGYVCVNCGISNAPGGLKYTVYEDHVEITGYTGDAAELVIPGEIEGKPVTAIGERAFYNCSGFAGELVIPDSVTMIGDFAFYGCSGFTGELVVPDQVTEIGQGAFSGMSGITSLVFGEQLSSIYTYSHESESFHDSNALYGMTGVKEVTFTGLTVPAMNECCPLTVGYAVVSSTDTRVALEECLYTFNLQGDGRWYITAETAEGTHICLDPYYAGKGGYPGHTEPAYVNLRDGFGENAVKLWDEVGFLHVHTERNASDAYWDQCRLDHNDTSHDVLLYRQAAEGETPSTEIPGYVLVQANVVDGVVTGIEDGGQYLIVGLHHDGSRTIMYPSESISNKQDHIATLEIGTSPDQVAASWGPFKFMTSLETVYVPADAYDAYSASYASYLPDTAKLRKIGVSEDFQIENGVLTAYFGDGGEVVIPDGVTQIGASVFKGCATLTKVTIPESVTTIGVSAFERCKNLEEVVFAEGLSIIGDHAFYGCGELSGLAFPESLTTIEANAFAGCGRTEGLVIPAAVTSISDAAFSNSKLSGKLVIEAGEAKTIGSHAFMYCEDLTGVELGNGITSIGYRAFLGCLGLTGDLVIPDSVTTIDEYAFSNCYGFDGTLTLSANLTSLGSYAFDSCTGFTGELVIPDGLKTIPNSAFYDCGGFTGDLVIPDSVTTIGAHAFRSCSGFDGTLTLPANLTRLGVYAFSSCSGFTGELVIPDQVTEIPEGVFSGMSGITSLVFGESVSSIYAYSRDASVYHSYNALYGMTGVKEVTFTGLTVPAMKDAYAPSWGPFKFMTSLETVYVPADAYDRYAAAYSKYVSDPAVIVIDLLTTGVSNLQAASVYSKTVVLTWDQHASDKIAGYTITRDGEIVGTTTDCAFTDRNLETNTTYTYSVYGYTADGKLSGAAEIAVTPCSPTITDLETDHSSNVVTKDNNCIYIHVENNGNFGEIEGDATSAKLYYVADSERVLIAEAERNESLSGSSDVVYTVDWDIETVDDGEYELVFVFTDVDGTTVEYSEVVLVDGTVPAQILGVLAIGDISVIHLTWAISAEVHTTTYCIYRRAESDEAFSLIAQIDKRNTLTYTDRDVEKGVIYYYYVVGVNEYGQKGIASEISSAALSDDREAPVVTKLTPANASYLTGTVTISLTAQDNVSVTQAELSYSVDDGATWIPFGSASAGSLTTALDTTAFDDGEIRIKGIARDAAGNESSALTYVYLIDNTGPEQVQGLRYESTDVTVTLSWSDVSDDDVRFYRVEQKQADGSYVHVTDVYSTLGVNIYDLTPDSSYIYRVVGYDIQGIRGIPSEDLTATTLADQVAPVITRIRPTSGYYSSSIDLSVTASDEYNVKTITLQVSADGQAWNDVYVKTYTNVSKSRTLSYTLSLDSYPEGYLFIRAIAADSAGNESDSSEKAPYVQHMVDKTPPAAPENVTAVGNSGYIEVAWIKGAEEDLGRYSVYRAEKEDGTYKLLKSGIAARNYIDRNVEENVVYYYKVVVDDAAGNISNASVIVSAQVARDTEAPVVMSIYPVTGSRIGAGYKTVSVLATDNNALDDILIEYSNNGETFMTLYRTENINTYDKTVKANIPVMEFSHGATVYIRVTATDKTGNQSETVTTQYTVDSIAPTAANASAFYQDESVIISWSSNQEADLIGYRIYRKTGTAGSYNLIAQRQVVAGQTMYSCRDYNLSIEKATYTYKIEAVDECGNVSSIVTSAVAVPDRNLPKPVISCDSTFEIGVEYIVDATSSTDNSAIVSYLFDFGDGTTSADRKVTHVYAETGEYTITLTVTDDDGNKATCTKTVTVKDRKLLGTAKIRIVDENGVAVTGVPVYFDLGEENQMIRVTDGGGYATFTAEVGRHTVGCVIANNKWLPVKKDIIVTAGNETSVSMTLVHHVMIEGQFEITRMTFEEIVAAGIDVSKPENQHMVKVHVTLTYGTETVNTSFNYNETTGKADAKPIIITTPDGDKREIRPVILHPKTNGGGGYTFSKETSVAFLDIPVGVSALKEFFNVNLHIINNAASEFSMIDNVINLNVPDGLSLVESHISQSDATVNIAEIKGQTTETITWILRGDRIGAYYLSADYSGILSEFDEPIYTEFVATEPIEVYGLSNLKLRIEIPDELDHGTFYYNVSLGNEGKIDVYRPNVDTGDVLIETELFNETGANVTEDMDLDAEKIDQLGLATSIVGVLDVLPAGYRLNKHYMCIDQTSYTEIEQKLEEYAFEVQNTYGLEIEIVTLPRSYFKSNLNANINAAEKADLTFTTNKSAYDYLMTNENYIYWSMYASTGAVASSLTTNAQETLWNLLSLATGSGGFKELFGADDKELIQAIILDAMEISLDSANYSKYYMICDWTKLVADWLENEGMKEWADIAEDWLEKIGDSAGDKFEKLGKAIHTSMPRTFKMLNSDYKWETYKAVYDGEYLAFDDLIIEKWSMIIKEDPELEGIAIYYETDASERLHDLFSKDGFKAIWKATGIALDVASLIVQASEKTTTDISLYFAAQTNFESCNLFLDTIIDYMDIESKDAEKVVKAAKAIKEKISELDLMGSVAKNLLDEAFWEGIKTGTKEVKKAALKKLGLTSNAYIAGIKLALKLVNYIGNNVFHVDERHDIADNIRFVSCITSALRSGIKSARSSYKSSKTDENAKNYMQLISYLLDIRAIGESQVAKFGITYEVLPGIFDSKDLFYAVRDMSGAEDARSWLEWRDFVEDRISMLRVQLLKNPLVTDVSGLTAPVVTFNYVTGKTVQTFSSDYEYSLNLGRTWTTCNGTAISVSPQFHPVHLMVRRVEYDGSSEKMTGSVMIYSPPSLDGSGIRVLETESGYRVENLDNSNEYEVTFSQSARSYVYGDALDITIPAGRYSYEHTTSGEYGYVYIRSLTDEDRYASYVFMPAVYPMSDIAVVQEGQGTITGVGSYEYEAEATLIATAEKGFEFGGWYENGVLISSDAVLTFEVLEDHTITAKFIELDICPNHVEEIIPGIEPTITQTGLTEGKKCSVCGEILVPQEVIPMLELRLEGDYFYAGQKRMSAYQMIKYKDAWYFIYDCHKIARNKTLYLSERFTENTGLKVGYYRFDAEGKLNVLNGIDGEYIYKDGERLAAYQLVEVDGAYYFIAAGNKIAKGTTLYLSEQMVKGTDFKAGYYKFDENGKMQTLNGIAGDYIYKDGVRLTAYQLVEFEGNIYFVYDSHKLARNCRLYLTERFVAGTGLTVGYYSFDAEGKLQVLNGPVGDYFYINNERQNAYQLVKFEGNIYFVYDSHKLAKNCRLYLTERFASKYDLPVGYYNFDADGKLITANQN